MREKRIDNYGLWQKLKTNNSEGARQELIIKYLSLVKYQVGRIRLIVPGFIEGEDLESYGILGLLDAIDKFDYHQGIEFETYASKRIRGEIMDYLRKLDWLPHSLRQRARQLKETASRISMKLGRRPTVNEIAEVLNLSREKIERIYYQLYSSQWISLFKETGENNQVLDIIREDSSQEPEECYQQKERENLLVKAIDRLNEPERLVISLYYYEELTQQEIAEVMELSPARVSQIHKKAINRLRGFLSRKKEQFI
jgi:RNA polymerase sigma factor FliA